ncbi:hypothetical protein J421_2853 [Gemmatirosa kalamazoonensis]|uniref:Uncharacterized protein n=1 Tax=Gemmatirosa kalamazoonensis TaxID=861299 RepID=W0RJ87_9BACT|nr:hypothetical protein [Gemmatirosa kalamazoonensis]AHG90390.1 hypothetical protein J421_2853 [Gemmatirosa kalamazoonensis]
MTNRWADAERVATRAANAPGSSPSLRIDATTALAAVRAVHGEVAAAGRILSAAAARSTGAEQRWYENARSILAIVSGESEPAIGASLASDSTPGAVQARGLRLAARGDTSGARAVLRHLDALPPVELARLGHGPVVIASLIDGRAGRWAHVIETLAPLARAGEHESLNADRAPSLIMRWIVADAYAHVGELDSAVVTMARAVDYRRVPPGHLVLRGLAYSFAQRRLAEWQERRGDRDASRRAWAAFRAAFTNPDPALRHLLVGAR